MKCLDFFLLMIKIKLGVAIRTDGKNKPFKGIKNTKRYFMDSKIRKMLTNAGIMLAGFAVIGSFRLLHLKTAGLQER